VIASNGDNGGWDENDGPSTACNPDVGCGGLGSESFQIYGTPAAAAPEPASLVLLGSGMLIFAGLMRKSTS